MDISVSHLNQRLMLQLPAQLPLGLVFVQGTVTNLTSLDDADVPFPVELDLVEDGYAIRCCLSARIVAEMTPQEGSRIRAGGHLVFDARRAQYQLQARDIELVVEEEPAEAKNEAALSLLEKPVGRSALTPVLADIKKRAEAAHLAQGTMPAWVQRLAPPEIKAEVLKNQEQEEVPEFPASPSTLDEGLVKFLAQAMEDLQDVEITPDLLEEYSSASSATAVSQPRTHKPPTPAAAPKRRASVDWAVLLLFLSVLLLLGVLIFISLRASGQF